MVDSVMNGGANGGISSNTKIECVVEYDYDSQLADELTIRVGDVITDIEMMDGGWWKGNLRGKNGMFPDNFVKLLPTPQKGSGENGGLESKKCHVLFSYTTAHDDELALEVGDIVEYMDDVEEGWYKGRLNGRVGVFPSNFVEICNTNCDNKSNHHKQQTSVEQNNQENSKKVYSELGAMTQINYGSKANISTAETNVNHKKVKSNDNSSPDVTLNHAKGSSSPTSAAGGSGLMTTSERLLRNTEPAPGAAPRLPPKPVKDQCVVLFPYTAQNQDELTLNEGEVITIVSRVIEDAGWWRGELDGKVGVFPDNFVKVVSSDSSDVTPTTSAAGTPAVTPPASAAKKHIITSLNGSYKQLSDKKFAVDNDKKSPNVTLEKNKNSPEKLHSTSPSSNTSSSSGAAIKLSRTSSERGSSSSSHTPPSTKMHSNDNSHKTASSNNDSFKSHSVSNVSEKKALFSSGGSNSNLKADDNRPTNSRSENRLGHAKTDDRVAKKPAVPDTLFNQPTSTASNDANSDSAKHINTNDSVILRNKSGLVDVDREQTLSSLTVSRVKAPKRRPPSNVFLKENVPEDVINTSEKDEDIKPAKNQDLSTNSDDSSKIVKKSSNSSFEKQFIPGKIGVSVFPSKDALKSKDLIKARMDSSSKNIEPQSQKQENIKTETNPVKNIWLEELSRKQANRKSMTALSEKRTENSSAGGKPAIPSKPLDTRKSLSSIIRRPNSFGDKTGSNSSTNSINQSGTGSGTFKTETAHPQVEQKSSSTLSGGKSSNNTGIEAVTKQHSGVKADIIRKFSGGGERLRRDSIGKENSNLEQRSVSPKRSLGDDRSSLTSFGRVKDASPRSAGRDSGRDSQYQSNKSIKKENKETAHPPRSSSKESERSRKSTTSELIRKASDGVIKNQAVDPKPSIHANNLGKPGGWSFAERPERPSDLGKLDFITRSKQDLTGNSFKSDAPKLESPSKSSLIEVSLIEDTREEAGFVVVEATNEAVTQSSLWATEDGTQPRPPAREKHQSGNIASANSGNMTPSSKQQDNIVKALEKKVEELERLIVRVEGNYKVDLANLSGQLEAERQRRIEIEHELSKLSRKVHS